MKRRLFRLFGPPLLAGALVLGLLLVPLPRPQLSHQALDEAAVSMSDNVLLGTAIKRQALANHFVPFIGSSELSRMDPLHPSVLAAKYHRNYRPLLLGTAGTQSLTHYLADQSWIRQYRNKRVVFIISPQWFVPQGVRPAAFQFFYSPMQTIDFIQNAHPNRLADRYAARRILQLSGKHSGAIHTALLNIAAAQPVGRGIRWQLRVQATLLRNEDTLFSRFFSHRKWAKIQQGERRLPAQADDKQLDALAVKIGAKDSSNNDLGIDNHFYKSRLSGDKLGKMRDKQVNFDYRRSPEYNDFQLLLTQFAQNHVQVQFIIPPINQKWAHYTGLNQQMCDQTVAKLETQLHSQGFDHVLNLSADGGEDFFMEDTIHLGWRGWVAVDRAVQPFLSNKQEPAHYRIQQRYLSKAWANATR